MIISVDYMFDSDKDDEFKGKSLREIVQFFHNEVDDRESTIHINVLEENPLSHNKDLAKLSIVKDCSYCFFKHYRRQGCTECLGCHNCSHFKPVPDNFQKPWEEK